MKEWVKAVVLDDETEARLVEGVLREQGVPFVLRSYHDSALDGLFQSTRGWGHVETPPEEVDRVKRIVSDLQRPPSAGAGG